MNLIFDYDISLPSRMIIGSGRIGINSNCNKRLTPKKWEHLEHRDELLKKENKKGNEFIDDCKESDRIE